MTFEAYVNLGVAQSHAMRFDDALATFTKLISLQPASAIAYNGRSWVRHLKGDDIGGLPDADKAVALDPKCANCFGTRAAIYEKIGRRSDAITGYQASLALDPHHQFSIDGLKPLGVMP